MSSYECLYSKLKQGLSTESKFVMCDIADIANVLEELKKLRAKTAELHDERQAESVMIQEHDREIKVDTIDEFYNRLLVNKKDINLANNPWNYIELVVREMIEQLKESK